MVEISKRGLLVAAFFAFIFLSLSSLTAQTGTNLDIPYAPPVLIENIPDQTWAVDTDLVNAFKLDDYFYSDMPLTYSHSSLTNIDVTIDSDSSVSFSPDAGFSGSETIIFTASDGIYNITSNSVELKVMTDVMPPQWNSPAKNKGTVFQNDFINFTTVWTDNVALKNFIFYIDQGSGWTEYAGTFSGMQNTSLERVQISASAGTLVRWKFAAWDSSDNTNETSVQNFTVSEIETPDSDTEDAPTTEKIVEKILSSGTKINMTVEPSYIKVKLKQGETVTRPIKITNTKGWDVTIETEVIGVEFASISETNFIIEDKESKSVTLEVKAPIALSPDIYFGKAVISSGNEVKAIPLIIEVIPINFDFEVSAQVLNENKFTRPGENVEGAVKISYTGDVVTKELTVYYAMFDLGGKIYDSGEEKVVMSSPEMQLQKNLTFSENTLKGDYVFFARVTSGETSSSDSDIFEVGEKFSVMAFIRLNVVFLIIVMVALILAALMINYRRNKKKAKLLNLYITANEMKNLLSERNFEEAAKVYIKLKALYGEPVSEETMRDKEKLKEEMKNLAANWKIENGQVVDPAKEEEAKTEDGKDKAEEKNGTEEEKKETKESENEPGAKSDEKADGGGSKEGGQTKEETKTESSDRDAESSKTKATTSEEGEEKQAEKATVAKPAKPAVKKGKKITKKKATKTKKTKTKRVKKR